MHKENHVHFSIHPYLHRKLCSSPPTWRVGRSEMALRGAGMPNRLGEQKEDFGVD